MSPLVSSRHPIAALGWKCSLSAGLAGFIACAGTADTITVCSEGPCDFTDIQTAIYAASNGDVIESCDYDGPGAALQHIYDNQLKPPINADASLLREFDQRPFWTADNFGNSSFNESMPHVTGFAPAGYIYVPAACRAKDAKCRMHFSLHGCSVNECTKTRPLPAWLSPECSNGPES